MSVILFVVSLAPAISVHTAYALNPPSLMSANINGNTLTLDFDDALDTGQTPVPSDITITGSITGLCTGSSASFPDTDTVSVTLDCTVRGDETITVDYTNNSGWIQDLSTNPTLSFDDQPVTNITSDTSAPILVSFTSSTGDGAY